MTQKSRQKHENLARFLKYLLGKSPDEFGVVLDPEGWIDLKRLVSFGVSSSTNIELIMPRSSFGSMGFFIYSTPSPAMSPMSDLTPVCP